MKFWRNQLLKNHTSLHIGGRADYFCQPKNFAELKEALAFARANKLPIAILGAGTNTLAADQGFAGLVIKIGLKEVKVKGRSITVGAGVLLPNLISRLAKQNLGGLEFLAGVPGSVGGAVVMNAGAWGKSIGDYILQIKALDKAGREKIFKRGRIKFAYRRSQFPRGQWLVTEVVLRLRKWKMAAIKKQIMDFLEKRRLNQPLGIPSCGSVFKNPAGKFAGQLIEAAGCKGLRVGDAQVSSRHANFIVNLGEARARDFLTLMSTVQKAVKEQGHVLLEPEVKIMLE